MECQVGITHDPERRRREWTQEWSTLHSWQILATGARRSPSPPAGTGAVLDSLRNQHGE